MDNNPSFLKYLISEEIYVVSEQDDQMVVAEEPKEEYAATTNNLKALLVVLEDLTDAKHETLQKLLTAIGVNDAEFSTNLDPGYSKYLVFGGGNAAKYQISTERDSQFLYSDDLAALNQDRSLKKQLWEKLQELFPQSGK